MSKPTKEEKYYANWRGWLQEYGEKKDPNFNLKDYDEDLLEELFANNFTTAKAYRELLSELPKEKEDIFYDGSCRVIELADEQFQVLNEKEFEEAEKTMAEFDGFAGIRVVGRLKNLIEREKK